MRATERMIGSKIERRVVEGIGEAGQLDSGRGEKPRAGAGRRRGPFLASPLCFETDLGKI